MTDFIEATRGSGFYKPSNGLNPQNNFFNSTITTNDAEVPQALLAQIHKGQI
jgi:7,8-dihydro-6-hydroxymethylpterin-pyrophosphokinase